MSSNSRKILLCVFFKKTIDDFPITCPSICNDTNLDYMFFAGQKIPLIPLFDFRSL